MTVNIFEGSRRIALLVAGIATLITLLLLVNSDPYVSLNFSIARPDGPFVRQANSCPADAATNYFNTKTNTGKSVAVNLCLLTMPFGENKNLIPYKVDDEGVIWGAASYSSEVSEYERQLERQFFLSDADSAYADNEISQKYWTSLREGIGYLVMGLVVFWMFVWAIGWIARGFLGIPYGMDRRPAQSEQELQEANDSAA